MKEWDAIVVGAGPAGSVAALGLAREGLSVLLVERERFPRWKVCGACVGPTAVDALASIGLARVLESSGALPLDRLRLVCSGRTARIPLRGNVAVSRANLDAALVRTCVAAGTVFRDGTSAGLEEALPDAVVVRLRSGGTAERARARVVIDASGLGSRLGPSAAARARVARRARVGIGVTLPAARFPLAEGELRMVVGRSGYVGLVRTEDGALTVGAAVDRDALSAGPGATVDAILRGAGEPPLGASHADSWKGTVPLTRRPARLAVPRLFRVGDAAGYVEPFTGEGIGWSVAAATAVVPAAVSAVERWSDALAVTWQRDHRRILARRQRMCRILAAGLRHPLLVRKTVALLGREPSLAAPLVLATSRPVGP